MKKITLCLFALVLSLSFFGCKNDVFNASIKKVFYTDDNPNEEDYDSLLPRSVIWGDKDYFLVVDFHQPNMDVVKLVLQYNGNEVTYDLTPLYENQYSWWSIRWTVVEDKNDQELTFYLEDAQGRRSAPKTIKMTFWK